VTATPVLQFTIYFKPDFFNTIGATSSLPAVPAKVPFTIRFADLRCRALPTGGLLSARPTPWQAA